MNRSDNSQTFGAFGIYRYFLAMMVVVNHSTYGWWTFVGNYAVFAFYILSGYVSSFILHHTYLPLPHGIRKYAINRALRIFPMYYAVLLLSLYPLAFYPEQVHEVVNNMSYPANGHQWLINLTTFGIVPLIGSGWLQPAIIPAAWTLSVEMAYWALMPILAKSSTARWIILAFTCMNIYIIINTYDIRNISISRYFGFYAALLPFYAGMILFRRKLTSHFVMPVAVFIAALAAFLILIVITPGIFPEPAGRGLYLSLMLNAIIIAYLAHINSLTLPIWLQRLDRLCGNLAYPIYLVHYLTIVSLHIVFPSLVVYSANFFVATVVASTSTAYGLYHLIDVPVTRLKRRFKVS